MDPLPQALAICQSAEKSLRDLMQSAIGAGQYRDLPTLARLAEQLNLLANKLAQSPDPLPSALSTPATSHHRATRRHRRRGRVRQSVQPPLPLRSIKTQYPRFRRDGDTLVKIGYSKSKRGQYEHRAPKRVAAALLHAIAAFAKSRSRPEPVEGHPAPPGQSPIFTVDALLPLPDPADHSELPAYQIYLALAWLRKEGLLQQHGREGYSLLVTSDLDKLMEERWNSLTG